MLAGLLGIFVSVLLHAQDPYALLPRNYVPELDNHHVRISRVKYERRETLPEHAHPALPTVYVYVRDGGPIRFSHHTPRFTITRPPVAAGTVRFNRNARIETHTSEYLGESATEYLRIELKTDPGKPHRDARFKTYADFPWEDEQVRIRKVGFGQVQIAGPAVVVDISKRQFEWIAPGAAERETAGVAFIVLELKTGPPKQR